MVDAYSMFQKKVRITSSPYLELNDTDNRVSQFEISFINEDSSEATFQISHTALKAVDSRVASNYYVNAYYPPLREAYATADLGQTEITVGAGETATFSVSITAPDVDDGTGPIFQGTIDISGSNGESVRVPYMGIVASTYNWTPFETAPLLIRFDADENMYYALQDSTDYYFDPSKYDSPYVYFMIRYGTQLYSFDIVDADYDITTYLYPPVAGENGFHGSIMLVPDLYNDNATFPLEHTVRFSSISYVEFQGFANGTKIPSGKYKLLSRAIKTFGRMENYDDWELYLSYEFNIALNGQIAGDSSSIEESSSLESSSTSSFEASSSSVSSSKSSSSAITSGEASVSSEEPSTSAVSSEESTETQTSELPTASPYKNSAIPTGSVDVITNITVYDSVSGGKTAYKGDVMTIAMTVEVTEQLEVGATTQFTMPGIFYDDLSADWPLRLSSEGGQAVALLQNNQSTNVWTITFDGAYVERFDYYSGTFTFNVRLQYTDEELAKRDATESVDLSSPVVVPVVFTTPSKEFTSYLEFAPYPTDKPFKILTVSDDGPAWDIYVPGSIGEWESVSFSVSVSTYEYWYLDCELMSTLIGSEKDAFGLPTSGAAAEAWEINCDTETVAATLTGSIESDETFKYHMAGLLRSLFYLYFTSSVGVTIKFADGSSKTYTLYDYVLAHSVGSGLYSVFPDSPVRPASSSAVESSAEVTSSAVESSAAESSSEVTSSGVESSAVSGVGSSAVSSDVETSAVESSTAESSAVVTSSGVESSAVSGVESSAVPSDVETSAVESSVAESSTEATSSAAAAESSVAESSPVPSGSESYGVESSAAESSVEMTSSAVVSSDVSSAVESSVVSSGAQPSVVESSADFTSAVSSARQSTAASSGFTGSSDIPSTSSASSESASLSNSGLPTLPEQRNPRTPIGLDIVTNIEIFDVVSNSADDVHPDHLLRIAVSISSAQPIDNESTQFTIPGIFYDFVSSFELYSAEGDYVATVSGDEATNVFTVTFDSEWARTHRNIRGTFSFDVRLSYTVTAIQKRAIDTLTLTGPSVVTIVFVTPGNEFTSTLTITSVASETPAASVGTGETSVFAGDLISSSSGASGASGATTATGTNTGATGVSTGATSATGVTTGTITNTERTVVTVTSCSQGICSEVLSTVSPTTTSPETTVVTITSCSNNACSTSVTTGLVTTVSTTVNGVETVYTTYCPMETESDAATKQTVTLTVTSCSENKCYTSTSEAILSTATTTINGHESVYTTYAPVSTTTVNKTSTAKQTGAATTTTKAAQVDTGITGVYASAILTAQAATFSTGVTVVTAATGATAATGVTVVTGSTAATSIAPAASSSSTLSTNAPVVTNNENAAVALTASTLGFLLSLFAVVF